jgi:hypothetical protein
MVKLIRLVFALAVTIVSTVLFTKKMDSLPRASDYQEENEKGDK